MSFRAHARNLVYVILAMRFFKAEPFRITHVV